jgi:spore coat protein H
MSLAYVRAGVLVLLSGLGAGSIGCGSDSHGLPPGAGGATGGSHVAGSGGGTGGLGGSAAGGSALPVDSGAGGSGGAIDPDAGSAGGAGGAGGTAVDTGTPPPDAPPIDTGPAVPPEVDGRLVINEIMASNGLTLKNEMGMYGDWIEIFNPTDQDISLAGYALTDDFAMPRKTVIGAGVVVPAGKYLVLWLDSVIGHGNAHLAMKLESAGGSLGLARPDGSFISKLTYGAQETDFSASREPDGSDAWVIEWHPSPNAANPAGAGKPLAVATPATPPELVPASGDLTEKLLGYEAIADLRLDIDADGIAKLLANPLVHVPATLTYQGRAYGPVGVRLKGHNSFEPIDKKPSLKIAVDKYAADARFFGLKDMTLNNMHSDATMMHERMAYWVARTAGVPASRASHALLSLNGKPPSLYVLVETVKHKMMTRWFKNPEGPLYEGTNVDFTRADTDYMPPRDDVPFFGLESKVDDRKSLYGMADGLAIASPNAAIAEASKFVNLDEFQTFWAVCSVIGQFDSMPYSIPGDDFFVYINPDDAKVNVLPWGMDETFEATDVNPLTRAYSVMATKCAASPACLQGYVNKTWALLEKMETMKWGSEHQRIIKQIAPFVAADPSKAYTDAMVTAAQADMGFFINERRQWLTKFLPAKSN